MVAIPFTMWSFVFIEGFAGVYGTFFPVVTFEVVDKEHAELEQHHDLEAARKGRTTGKAEVLLEEQYLPETTLQTSTQTSTVSRNPTTRRVSFQDESPDLSIVQNAAGADPITKMAMVAPPVDKMLDDRCIIPAHADPALPCRWHWH
jgi:hypothetical protein